MAPSQQLRTSTGDTVARNLTSRPVVRGGWSAQISGGQAPLASVSAPAGPGSVRQAPLPSRRWSGAPGRPGSSAPSAWQRPGGATPAAPVGLPASASGNWRAALSGGTFTAVATAPSGAMEKALRTGTPQGFRRRQSLSRPLKLAKAPTAAEVNAAIEATYRQLLNRQPLAAERLGDAESQLRDGQLSVAEFVAVVAESDLFQNRLDRLAPLRGAAAAYLALLGRAAQPAEASRYLSTRVRSGQRAAVRLVLNTPEYASSFGQDTVPFLRGLRTSDGIPLTTVNRTASLYGGNAALNPPPRGAV